MKNNLRTDITIEKDKMTKEQLQAYDAFIDLLVELFYEYGSHQTEKGESQVAEELVE